MKEKNISAIRKEKGKSNAFKYAGVKSFAGPNKTFPINTPKRARNALSRAHFAKNPSAIKAKVHAKYPSIEEDKPKHKSAMYS